MSEGTEVSVIVVDDHPVVLEGLRRGLGQQPGLDIVAACNDPAAVLRNVARHRPQVVLTDLKMPDREQGLQLIRNVMDGHPNTRCVVLTYSEDPDDLFEANQAGAAAYVLKDSSLEEIAKAVKVVAAGGRPPLKPELEAMLWSRLRETAAQGRPYNLTDREWNVLRLISQGYTNQEICQQLYLSGRTVRRAATEIFRKLNVRNRAEAASFATQKGWFLN